MPDILAMGRPFEVVEAVVRPVAVFVVDLILALAPGQVEGLRDEDVDEVELAVDLDATVALFVGSGGLDDALVSLKRPREETIAFSYGFQIVLLLDSGGTQITSALFFVYLSVFVNTRRHQNKKEKKEEEEHNKKRRSFPGPCAAVTAARVGSLRYLPRVHNGQAITKIDLGNRSEELIVVVWFFGHCVVA